MIYSDRHKLFAGKTIISYPSAWGGQFKERYWMAEMNNEGDVDYGSKQYLIDRAVQAGRKYVVLRVHKDFTVTVLESS